ncbi:aromatic ring-hydroxylating dioxygenase subunit alpha [Actinomadura sp. KC216]|uniref:Rieske 2Fe-2S domain-containing protein n=1 Tax=Actinomadura sp. KC216 TaxID=2530370 RepID=UPI0010529A7D|nr:Rieske 2Fe-2S domain-containing protein [Actinomadura sp. KC216]TDB91394.1 aromatic ring-hydroxylating dioxygenase subunit alpha [Actinomadura sp. KC216]
MTETANATSPGAPKRAARRRQGMLPGRQDWSTWPHYQAAASGFRGYWYPVCFADQVGDKPRKVRLLGEDLFVIRDGGRIFGMKDRCPHRGVPLSYGNKQFPGTVSCVYHGWTFQLETGDLVAAITDGPRSPICGKVRQPTYDVEERLGMVWVYVGDGERPHPIDEQLPEELVDNAAVLGQRIQPRAGNWRFACENGYDEGHAKYLHRAALWRLFKPMPVWNTTKIVKRGRWIYRVQEKQYWEAEFPGLGRWSGQAWYKARPPKETRNIGNTSSHREVNPVIAAQEFPGFASVAMPGVLRIAYPTFIHYEFYVPVDADNHLYVGVMADFQKGVRTLPFYVKYLGAVRWLFHGQFSGQDRWMVEVTDAPPERLYRPDESLLQWRRLAEDTAEARLDRLREQGLTPADPTA